MRQMIRCPLTGGECGKTIRVQEKTFFLAEPEESEEDREERKIALREALEDEYKIRSALEEKQPYAFDCKICEMIQSCAYGIADITGENPNVMLELGIMIGLGKPAIVLQKKGEEGKLKLPSDLQPIEIVCDKYIKMIDPLREMAAKLPAPVPLASPMEEAEKALRGEKPKLAEEIRKTLEEYKDKWDNSVAEFKKAAKEARLDGSLSEREHEVEISPELKGRLDKIEDSLKHLEKSGFVTDARTAFLRGNFHYDKGEYELALEQYEWVLTLEPERYEAWNNKGVALDELNRLGEALTCYDKAIEIKPDYYQAWYNKGVALNELNRYEEVIKCFDKAIKIKPGYYQAWYNKGVALDELNRYEEAIKCFDKAIKIKPDDYQTWVNKGVALDELDRYEEAIKCFDKAIEIKLDGYEAWSNKGVALDDLNRPEEAIKCFDKAIEIKLDGYETWANKGVTLDDLNRPEEAIKCFDKAIEIKPDFQEAWSNKGVALRRLDRPEEAIKCSDKAIELKPDGYEAWHNKGVALAKLNRHNEAIICFEKAIEIEPNDIDTNLSLAEVYLITGDYKKGLDLASKALQISPVVEDKCTSYFLSFSALLLRGKADKAEQTLDELLEYLKGIEKGYGVTWDFSDITPVLEKLEAPVKDLVHSLIALLQEKIDIEEFSRRRRGLA